MIPGKFDTDVLVIGGGPAGLAAAVAARRKGFHVTLADCSHPPVDKACGEGLMPDGLAAFRQLGFTLDSTAGFPFRGIRFRDETASVEASFPQGCGMGVRRTTLHTTMVDTAARAGVNLMWGTRVTRLAAEGAWFGNRLLRARWTIGADGGNSRVRLWAGLHHDARERRRFGFRRHYQIAPWSDHMELYWGRDAQIYVTPVGVAEVCVVAISRDSRLRLGAALAEFPSLGARLRQVGATTPELGAISASRRLSRVFRGRVALIGDASGSVDAITGEGLCLAFRQALALANALERDDLASYEAAHRRLMRRPSRMAALLLAFEGHPWLQQRALRSIAARPALFENMLALHVGARRPADFAANALAFGWNLLGGRILMRRS
jgi:flavin-dependent dehydrogenase